MNFPSINYPLISPLNYNGYGVATHSTRFTDKPKYMNQLQLHFSLGYMNHKATESYIAALSLQGNWSKHLYLGKKTGNFRFLAGCSVDAAIDVYFKDDNTNNPVAYFVNLSLSPGIIARYRINTKPAVVDIGQQIDIPFISLVSMSGYSSSLPYAFTEREISNFKGIRFASFGSFIKCAAISSIDIIPSRKKYPKCPTFRVSYIFSGMDYKHHDQIIKSIDHTVLLGAVFRLFRY